MPKGFSDAEKEHIRAKLLEVGEKCLVTTGVRRTTVEDLAKAAYISKGAFYLFFDSKEALFYASLGQFEQAYRRQLLALIERPGRTPRARFIAFLRDAMTLWQSSPLFTHFNGEEYQNLARKLPGQVIANRRDDQVFFADLMKRWKVLGVQITCTPAEFVGLANVLFFITLHADDIGEVFPKTCETLIQLIAQQIVRS